MSGHPAILGIAVGALLGASIGSYLACVLWRIPRRISIYGHSICPNCGTQLKAQWNIPILGWVALRGRSACCQTPISVRYPLIEAAGLAVGVALGALGAVIAPLASLVLPCAAAGLVIVVTALTDYLHRVRYTA